MCTASLIFFLLLGLYLEKVLPSSYGTPLPWNFIFKPSYWRKRPHLNSSNVQPEQESRSESEYLNPKNYERPDRDVLQLEQEGKALQVEQLTKDFDNGFRAVDQVSLNMHQGKIFVLLGHNGAGKTTLISMLTGLLPSSEGRASLYGVDLMHDMASVRDMMGVCPQQNALFELLTPYDHLDIFYEFKGADPASK